MTYYLLFLPEILLAACACGLLLFDRFLATRHKIVNLYCTLAILFAIGAALALTIAHQPAEVFGQHFVVDFLGSVTKLWVIGITFMVLLYSRTLMHQLDILCGEYYVLILFSILGILVMISSTSMLSAYLGLELFSLSLYALVALRRDDPLSSEAALKYLVLGALSSGIFLYGVSLIYGTTGSVVFAQIAETLPTTQHTGALLLALVCIVTALAFKLSAAPFHMWLPDVYQGAPIPVTTFIASVSKIAVVVLTLRILAGALGELHIDWHNILIPISVLSLAVGNLLALLQNNIRRLLAYSTVSHIGFVLLGVLSGTEQGYASSVFYTLTYALTVCALFGTLTMLDRQRETRVENISDLSGLLIKSPWLGSCMIFMLLSLAGIPPTVGFYAKLLAISAVSNIGLNVLALAALLFSVVAAYYYLRLIKTIAFDQPEREGDICLPADGRIVLLVNTLALVLLSVMPGVLLDICLAGASWL